MSYSSITKSTQDQALVDRVTAAVAQEAWKGSPPAGPFTDIAKQTPTSAASTLIWPVCSASDVEAAYASALAAGNPNPGGDEAVISDGMILANVQANWPVGS